LVPAALFVVVGARGAESGLGCCFCFRFLDVNGFPGKSQSTTLPVVLMATFAIFSVVVLGGGDFVALLVEEEGAVEAAFAFLAGEAGAVDDVG